MDYLDLQAYDYELPPDRIAQTPADERPNSRLLHCNPGTGRINDTRFHCIKNNLGPDDILVLNTSRVRCARLMGRKSIAEKNMADDKHGARIETLILQVTPEGECELILKPARRIKPGHTIILDNTTSLEITRNSNELFYARMCRDGEYLDGTSIETYLLNHGELPTPPYITKQLSDQERYQTVYAGETGSAAAPTAGLHFSRELLSELRSRGVEIIELILHIGLGTFTPVRCDNLKNHHMHSEFYRLSEQNAARLNNGRDKGKSIICVGTTALRALEANIRKFGRFRATAEETDIFIHPPQKIQAAQALVTNFHLPKSTLLMLVSSFAGFDFTRKCYRHALAGEYRFFSFGDAMFIDNRKAK